MTAIARTVSWSNSHSVRAQPRNARSLCYQRPGFLIDLPSVCFLRERSAIEEEKKERLALLSKKDKNDGTPDRPVVAALA